MFRSPAYACKVLRGHGDRNPKTSALRKQNLEARGLDSSVLVHHHAEGRCRVRRKRSQHVREPALHNVPQPHGTGVAYGGKAYLPEILELARILVHGWYEGHVDTAACYHVHSVYLAVRCLENTAVVVHKEGESPAEVGPGVAVLFRKVLGLLGKLPGHVPAHCRKSGPQGQNALLGQVRAPCQGIDFRKAHEILADDADGERYLAPVAHFDQNKEQPGDEGLGVVREDGVAVSLLGHEREKKLGQLVGSAVGKGVLRIGLAQGCAHVALQAHGLLGLLVCHVGEQQKIVVPAHDAAHGVNLGCKPWCCLGIHIGEPRALGKVVEGKGHEGLGLAGTGCAKHKHVGERVPASDPQLPARIHLVAKKEASPGPVPASFCQDIPVVHLPGGLGQAHGQMVPGKAFHTHKVQQKRQGHAEEHGLGVEDHGKGRHAKGKNVAFPAHEG